MTVPNLLTSSSVARPPVSVCMATYNGAEYLQAQLLSILEQLKSEDELIVVDDGSDDSTTEILQHLVDHRMHVYVNTRNQGHVRSFERALSLATNGFILMADQDDIWPPNRVNIMVAGLMSGRYSVLSSNSTFIDGDCNNINYELDGVKSVNSHRHLSNILSIFIGSRRYYGCAMAMRRDFLSIVLPIPNHVESHDLWIAMAANVARSNIHLDEYTLIRRLHGKNASIVSRKLFLRLWSRVVFFESLMCLLWRITRQLVRNA